VATPGYHPGARVYLHLDLNIPPVSPVPTVDEVEQAREWLLWVIRQFPFKTDSDKAHAIALEIGLFVRDLIPGNVPMFGVKAPNRSGKGKLIATLCAPAIGPIAAMPPIGRRGEDELRKRLTALVLQGTPVAFFDNVSRIVEGSALAAIVTAPRWRDRVLGESRLVDLPVRSFWILAGQGLQFDRELLLRSVRIQLHPNVPHPERRIFEEPKELPEYALEHRAELIWACLTIVQRWIASDRPEVQTTHTLGGFEGFVRVMGGILQAAGIKGFLDGLEDYHDEGEAETDSLPAFVAAWWEKHTDTPLGTESLIDLPESDSLIPARKDETTRARATRLGRRLGKDLDRVFEIQPDDREPPNLVKLTRGDYKRDAGKGKRKGFFLVLLSGGVRTDNNIWDVGGGPEQAREIKENPPLRGDAHSGRGGNVGGQKLFDFQGESTLSPTSPISDPDNRPGPGCGDKNKNGTDSESAEYRGELGDPREWDTDPPDQPDADPHDLPPDDPDQDVDEYDIEKLK
jgi:hypothetical protein